MCLQTLFTFRCLTIFFIWHGHKQFNRIFWSLVTSVLTSINRKTRKIVDQRKMSEVAKNRRGKGTDHQIRQNASYDFFVYFTLYFGVVLHLDSASDKIISITWHRQQVNDTGDIRAYAIIHLYMSTYIFRSPYFDFCTQSISDWSDVIWRQFFFNVPAVKLNMQLYEKQ